MTSCSRDVERLGGNPTLRARRRRPAAACSAAPSATSATSLEVPPGAYDRTYANDGSGPTGQSDPASVSGFRLDRYLVTVGRFRQFVAASVAGWSPAAGSGKHAHLNGGQGLANSGGPGYEPGWDRRGHQQLATTAADWMARLNCEPSFDLDRRDGPARDAADELRRLVRGLRVLHLGRRFPAERSGVGVRGGGRRRAARVSLGLHRSDWIPRPAAVYLISDCNYPPGSTACSGAANIAPVGTATLGAGRWGQLDLAGELAEWTLDWYAPYVDPCVDCVYLTDFSYRVVRGGSFGTDTEDVFPRARDGDVPGSRNAFYGFRCARSP